LIARRLEAWGYTNKAAHAGYYVVKSAKVDLVFVQDKLLSATPVGDYPAFLTRNALALLGTFT
jgi:hypothetical protein